MKKFKFFAVILSAILFMAIVALPAFATGDDNDISITLLEYGDNDVSYDIFDENLKFENYDYQISGGNSIITGFNTTFPGRLVVLNSFAQKPVIRISNSAFKNCSLLTNIVIPAGVETISASAFAGCTALKEVRLPFSITTIDDTAFSGCTNLVLYIRLESDNLKNYAVKNSLKYEIKGDINADKKVTVADAIYLVQHLANPVDIVLTEIQTNAIDVSNNGAVNVSDAIKLKQYIASGTTVILD